MNPETYDEALEEAEERFRRSMEAMEESAASDQCP